jgi:Flp pilus assembly protein TadG
MRNRRLRGDEGSATTELVIIAPVLVSMIVLVIQFGLYFHASSVASAAAQEGAGTAAVFDNDGGRVAHGEQEARDFVRTMAPELLTNVRVEGGIADGGDSVRMTVTAEVVDIFAVPGVDMDLDVHEAAESVIEEFRPADEAPPGS